MRTIKISNERPPQWILNAVQDLFNVEWESGVVFTYGDLITTFHGKMREDLMHHEPVHSRQQKEFGGAEQWWEEYLVNKEFRFEQELEAYRAQYKWIMQNEKQRQWFKYLEAYANDLSGDMYGNLITKSNAMKAINSY